MGFRANRHPVPDWVPAPLLQTPGPKHHYHFQHFFPYVLLSQGLGPSGFSVLRPRSGLSLSRSSAPGLGHGLWCVPPATAPPRAQLPTKLRPGPKAVHTLLSARTKPTRSSSSGSRSRGSGRGRGRRGRVSAAMAGRARRAQTARRGRWEALAALRAPSRRQLCPRGAPRAGPPAAPRPVSPPAPLGGGARVEGGTPPRLARSLWGLCHQAAIQRASLQGHKKGSYSEPAGAAGAERVARIPRTFEMRDLGRVSSPL